MVNPAVMGRVNARRDALVAVCRAGTVLARAIAQSKGLSRIGTAHVHDDLAALKCWGDTPLALVNAFTRYAVSVMAVVADIVVHYRRLAADGFAIIRLLWR